MRVLLTGGSGFLASHCIDCLLKGGHSVVVTVRSRGKGNKIIERYSQTISKLSYVVVEDIAKDGAFDEAVKSKPSLDAVIHTASPYHFRFADFRKEMIDPVLLGTKELLKSIKKNSPSVKRVVLTSSFAAMVTVRSHPKIYNESSWNDVTWDEVLHTDKFTAWRGSKAFAEKAAWEFIERENPNFQLSTINPPLMFGPVLDLDSLEHINTSNERIRDMIQGKMKDRLSPTAIFIWADVRDVALAHVRAMENSEAAGKRFLCSEGYYSNADIVNIIKQNFPELEESLPGNTESDIDMTNKPYEIDNNRSKEILGLRYRSLEESVKDTVDSLLAVGE